MNFTTGQQLLELCKTHNIKISEVMIEREIDFSGISEATVINKMAKALEVMKKSVNNAKTHKFHSLGGGYIGGECHRILDSFKTHAPIAGLTSIASAYAMGVLEINASMGLIVAAPTAGSSGVLPGILIAAQELYGFTDDDLLLALFNAGAIGYLIARGATLSGAEGGCQAEVGAASAMAASALCELFGGTPEQCLTAAGDAISNILGLICDPIGGLVEAPCQKRNAMGVANAVTSCEIAMACCSSLIPFDEVIKVMKNVGSTIPYQLRETSLGGLATAPSARNARNTCGSCNMCN